MVNIWSNAEFTRKVKTIKDNLRYKDNFYNDKMLTRVVTKTDASGLYNRNVSLSYKDTVVSGIIVYRSESTNYDNEIEVIDADAQFTCEINDKDTIINADELWLDYELLGSNVVNGTMYKIKSHRNSLFDIDHVFELVIAGKKNG